MPRGVFAVAAATVLLLVGLSAGYGYHRDELYFLAAGKHLDWAYADQGVLTPLIAAAMDTLAPGSLVALRTPSALAAGAVVLLAALTARDLGGSGRAQIIAAATTAVSTIVLFNGHLLSTSTFDLLAWTAAIWCVVRAQRDPRWWLAAGAVTGLGLLNKPLPVFLAVGIVVGLAIAGPRRHLWSPWLWGGVVLALAGFAPFLVWQAAHGWPQLEVSAAIADGGSTSSEPWWAVVPFQVLLVSPLLAPVWIAGLVRLLRDAGLRFLGVTWLFLAVVFMITAGKPYYLAGLIPLLLAAGAIVVDGWIGERRLRRAVVVAVVALCAVTDAIIALPVLPVGAVGPVVAMNEDVGETIGWPELAETVAQTYARHPGAVVVTTNYGQAGAIDRFGPAHGLPRAYSGHNSYAAWGRPPDGAAPVVLVGFEPARAAAAFSGCTEEARIRTPQGIDNEEDGAIVLVCEAPKQAWSTLWPKLRHLS